MAYVESKPILTFPALITHMFAKRWAGIFRFMPLLAVFLLLALSGSSAFAASTVLTPGSATCASNDPSCNICVSKTFSSPNLGEDMINGVFDIINKILDKIQSSFYTGIVGNASFQQIIGVAFILYLVLYGIMIMFNLASYRSGEVYGRLIKIAIIYAATLPDGWTFFSTWVQKPIINGINEIIIDIASVGGGGSGKCVTTFASGGAGPISTNGSTSISLATAPMAMLFGPMTCVFAAQFVTGIEALIMTGFYGWILALIMLLGLVEFSAMILGAIVTYAKAVIGLTFLFGIAPIFIIFYLFQKTRSLTEGLASMILAFTLQPIMLFTFLAFYAGIIGTAVASMFTDSSGNQIDICYVPWYTMPGLFSVYWWRFTNQFGAAGGHDINGIGSGFGDPLPPRIQILNILCFYVLCNLGKNCTQYVESLSNAIAGGRGAGITTGNEVGSYFRNNIMGGRGPLSLAAGAGGGAARRARGLVGKGTLRPPMGGGSGP